MTSVELPALQEEIVRRIRLSLMRKGVRFEETALENGVRFRTNTGSSYTLTFTGDDLEVSFVSGAVSLSLRLRLQRPEYLPDFLSRLTKLRYSALRLSDEKP